MLAGSHLAPPITSLFCHANFPMAADVTHASVVAAMDEVRDHVLGVIREMCNNVVEHFDMLAQ